MELYVQDYFNRSGVRHNDSSYKDIDIYEEKGFDDYSPFNEHQSIRDVLSQFAMIDPIKVLETFNIKQESVSSIE